MPNSIRVASDGKFEVFDVYSDKVHSRHRTWPAALSVHKLMNVNSADHRSTPALTEHIDDGVRIIDEVSPLRPDRIRALAERAINNLPVDLLLSSTNRIRSV